MSNSMTAGGADAAESGQKQKMPRGIPYIVGNEAAERFSFYGMKTILVIFMTKYLMDSSGQLATMDQNEAMQWYHSFVGMVYFFPLLGALLSDIFWGKYKTILSLSVVYCLGHLSLAFMDIPMMTQILEPKAWLGIGLGLIAFGSGGIKPCVSAHVGDQFRRENSGLLDKVFSWFYFSINFGGFFASLFIPLFLEWYGPAVAFGVPGVLMFIATFVFWLGRKKFIAIPAMAQEMQMKQGDFKGEAVGKAVWGLFLCGAVAVFFWQRNTVLGMLGFESALAKFAFFFAMFAIFYFVLQQAFRGFSHLHLQAMKSYSKEVFSRQGLKAIFGLGMLYLFIACFWSLYDQTGSSWVLQAEKMNRWIDLRVGPLQMEWLRFELLSAQIQSLNPILIMLYIPLFQFVIYPLAAKFVRVTPLRKIGVGFFITGLSFALIATIEHWIQAGATPSIFWQFLAYMVITAGEVLISITVLEFSYTQAPNAMKSIIMSLFLLSVSIGNFITAGVNRLIQNADGTVSLAGPAYFWFFTGLVLMAGLLYIVAAIFYKEESYIQDWTAETASPAEA